MSGSVFVKVQRDNKNGPAEIRISTGPCGVVLSIVFSILHSIAGFVKSYVTT